MFSISSFSICAILVLVNSVLSIPAARHDPQSIVQNAYLAYRANTMSLIQSGHCKCTTGKMLIRKAWDDLPGEERRDFLDAVKCIHAKPSTFSPGLVPGARTLWDDFTYVHINQTNFIHFSALLLPWHRQYMWAMERTLRDECGYTGALPYWAWERHSDNQARSPVFQADAFGGNGMYIPHDVITVSTVGLEPAFAVPREPGTGGGCITDGAFVNFTVHLGPVSPANAPDNQYGTQYNPQCITRDFLQSASSANLTHMTIANLLQTQSIHDFHPLLEFTAHVNSHGYVGGWESDLYASPNDPIFFLIHSQIDRIWTIWQGLDYNTRLTALDGTLTLGNNPPSANATLDSIMHMGSVAGGDLPISHAMNAVGGDYCYIYA